VSNKPLQIHFGTFDDKPAHWRKKLARLNEPHDEVPVDSTPANVIAMLGFDLFDVFGPRDGGRSKKKALAVVKYGEDQPVMIAVAGRAKVA
jgi:hypothetical protein